MLSVSKYIVFAGFAKFAAKLMTDRCHFSLPSVEAEDDPSKGKMPPIKVKFEIPYFTVSGIQVRFTILVTVKCIKRQMHKKYKL